MSQRLRTRVAIGSATQLRSATPRTINEAFGPYARLDVERSTSARVDRIIGRFCVAILCAAFAALIVSRWGM